MSSSYRHTPIFDTGRKRCSVCNHPVYSQAEIHPQCAVKLAEDLLIRTKKLEAAQVDPPVAAAALGKVTAAKLAVS
jgi:hypothetical protein